MLSICIPTFNRASYLKEALESICVQFVDPDIFNNVKVYILDNQSADATMEVVATFASRFTNITYLLDSEKRGLAAGIVKVASLATGDYVWIFSDDDIMAPGCLKKIVSAIAASKPDLLILNIDSFIEKNKIHQTNLFLEQADRLFKDRRGLFEYLNSKFYYTIDYYTTYCSNWLLRKDFYDKTKYLFDTFNSKLDIFPLPSIVFYSQENFSTKIISETQVLFRADNASWVRKNPISNFFYSDALWRHHYRNIVKFNKQYLPPYFRFKVKIKNALRVKDLTFLVLVLILKKIGLFNFVRNIYKKIKK